MFTKILKLGIGSDLIIYVLRCFIGFLIGYGLYIHFPRFELFWTMLSIILVISPEAKDSRRLAVERFKSNLIGSSIGFVCFFITIPQLYVSLFGIVLSIIVCYLLNLMNVARGALVAFVIVLLHEQDELTWTSAFERFLSVAVGCFIGLAITMITSKIINYGRRKLELPEEWV